MLVYYLCSGYWQYWGSVCTILSWPGRCPGPDSALHSFYLGRFFFLIIFSGMVFLWVFLRSSFFPPDCWTSFFHVIFLTFLLQWAVCFFTLSLSFPYSISLLFSPVVISAPICFCSSTLMHSSCGSQLVASINFSMHPLATPFVACCWFFFSCCFLSFCLTFWQSLGCLDYCLENYWFPADLITNSQQIFW